MAYRTVTNDVIMLYNERCGSIMEILLEGLIGDIHFGKN